MVKKIIDPKVETAQKDAREKRLDMIKKQTDKKEGK